MKFRTELQVKPLERPIRYNEPIFAIGSCFTDEVGARLKGDKFRITHNPLGTLFNPLSIYGLLGRALHDVVFTPNEVQRHTTGECFLYGLPTRFTFADESELLDKANEALYQTKLRFHEADHVLVTFGTAWLYRIGGEVVANCHKQPHNRFERKLATLHEITQRWSLMLQRHPEKQFIFTVSPIRHLGEGAEGNAVSKATLRLAVEELCTQHPNAHYFPAYELLLDDLRDYRFYADDLCHPS
ncbi:MAG: GSCFA domain-containing protein, partial [Alistipes sp.]|nr:GSCFA domain-containing protein [Alistipes sp.]